MLNQRMGKSVPQKAREVAAPLRERPIPKWLENKAVTAPLRRRQNAILNGFCNPKSARDKFRFVVARRRTARPNQKCQARRTETRLSLLPAHDRLRGEFETTTSIFGIARKTTPHYSQVMESWSSPMTSRR